MDQQENQNRWLNAILETAIVGIAVLDKQGKFHLCNAHWLELFGYTREEMYARFYKDATYPDDLPDTIRNMEILIAGKVDHYHTEKRYVRKDGSIFWGYVSVNAIRDEKGTLESLVATLFDLTERKQIEEELIHTQELLRTESRQLQKENLRSQFEMLKSQHFLFNSLNVLTSLIKLDPDLAEKFAEQMSKVYRYVLEHREEDLVSLRSEIDFISSYIFLLEIRFRDKVKVELRIPDEMMELSIAPLALQLLIENAVKHNTFSKKQPLTIEIFTDEEHYLLVVNNLQRREMKIEGTGVGLMNIEARFRHLTDKPPFFGEQGDRFVARIPLLNEKNS
jgi:PAS domain S-box-containing protein